MSKSQLLAHCDTDYVEEEQVKAIPEPPFTKTWRPVSHAKVIESLEHACIESHIGIEKRYYSLNKTGTRMFGVWDLDYTRNGTCYSLGFRNSIDKSMVVGVVGGFRVFVCDNLALSGQYLQFHKHTGGLDMDRLFEMSKKALAGAWIEMERLWTWINELQNIEVSGSEFKKIVYNLMAHGVFPASQFGRFHNAFQEERGPNVFTSGNNLVKFYDKGSNLKTIHGACTRLMRGSSLFKVADRNRRLVEVCDDYVEYRKAA